MKCTGMSEHLMDVAAGLPAEPQVVEHLHACPACAEKLKSLRSTMTLLDEWQAPEPSPYFDTRLQARLREEAAHSHGWLQWLRKPALAGAMAALLLVGTLLYIPIGNNAIAPPPMAPPPAGTAVADLQDLDKNYDLFANFDLLDDLSDEPQTANP
jgi:predicted anti-sigma-YlaC factor YlaD